MSTVPTSGMVCDVSALTPVLPIPLLLMVTSVDRLLVAAACHSDRPVAPVTHWSEPWCADAGPERMSSDGRANALGPGKRIGQLVARADCELAVHLSQVPLDRARAEEQPRTDLRVRQPIASQLCDLPLLGGQIVARLDRPLACFLARRQKLPTRALCERFDPHRREHVVRRAELCARVDPAILAAQPFAVHQMGAGERGKNPAALKPGDRLSIQVVRVVPGADESVATSLGSQRPVRATGARGLRQARERLRCGLSLAAPYCGLDELGQAPIAKRMVCVVRASLSCRLKRLVVATETVEQHGVG